MTHVDPRFAALPRFYWQNAPFTFCIGFVERRLAEVRSVMIDWRAGLNEPYPVEECPGHMPDALSALIPLGARRRELWFETSSHWTAVITNEPGGGMITPMIVHFTRMGQCRGVVVTCIPHTVAGKEGQCGAVVLEMYSPGYYMQQQRFVGVSYDSGRGWRFTSEGELQGFESLETYGKRIIRDRFTPATLLRCCEALEIEPYNPEFYGPHAFVGTFARSFGSGMSLEQAQVRANLGAYIDRFGRD